ncbi:spermidine synthase [Trichophyton rubrum D6]|uniref:Spermidine synthase n=3 Tax=Trichophyton TaxID=5550 RepID=A0A080WEG5_TRIRC|nr:spermidine synthase [Trichophyton rubrum CBS 118892]EZF09772.1 spermidine synthase [Trichophyton rubrum MR850]EZF36634.1 spermidine synthase [Trichophyton rubrum CBS 100081]EZF47324.1 spermidine synthase [Trichophyton rubrum CBS 288.86]EZF57963.1 spermidine synthase [Trichophyton rubrum CBS 289.86]EZF68612.1 spermidine synthase [Trichophyton soudanense CBS 452.61]EZF79287.1 spermidine synthase [Trichophyton rubrum MR1448]EZF90258.1 spermidine synthase [Trichophyton rubrum MR1459]EZG00866
MGVLHLHHKTLQLARLSLKIPSSRSLPPTLCRFKPKSLSHHTVRTPHNSNSTAKMSEITHPTIKDGWFSEVSDMWPGQAMNLRVNQILHHEKSDYQDVLVFESSDHGTVLVLDNVIQCTERDEFSYQEMITHLAMNSHPNPKKVLVIGGGDGGVLREIVKHDTVEEAVLCDIDEAVIRVSKKYLPGMSVGFQHPNAKVYVRDGFKFLEEQKNQFDVIITDSSDPEGPAEVLFQKPYFELLYGALREGGVISTQGCSSPLRPLLVSFALCFHTLLLRFGLRRYPDFILHFRLHFARSLCRLLFHSFLLQRK